MRGYITAKTIANADRCRGGFYHHNCAEKEYGGYSLEIGGICNANAEMVVVGTYCKEIIEFLRTKRNESGIAEMLLDKIAEDTKEFNKIWEESYNKEYEEE